MSSGAARAAGRGSGEGGRGKGEAGSGREGWGYVCKDVGKGGGRCWWQCSPGHARTAWLVHAGVPVDAVRLTAGIWAGVRG